MAENGAHSSNASTDPPNHLNTNIESGEFDEKVHHDTTDTDPTFSKAHMPHMDEEEDEDMDALIDELESQDGHQEEEEGEAEATPGGGRVVPEDQLQTDTRIGLTESEVLTRRKKYGMNQMKEEKENLILKFLGYFIGPIQFVMEVCYLICYSIFEPFTPQIHISLHFIYQRTTAPAFSHLGAFSHASRSRCLNTKKIPNPPLTLFFDRLLLYLLLVLKIGSILVSFVPCYCSTLQSVSFKNSKPVQLSTN
jgi:hypothetical protein